MACCGMYMAVIGEVGGMLVSRKRIRPLDESVTNRTDTRCKHTVPICMLAKRWLLPCSAGDSVTNGPNRSSTMQSLIAPGHRLIHLLWQRRLSRYPLEGVPTHQQAIRQPFGHPRSLDNV